MLSGKRLLFYSVVIVYLFHSSSFMFGQNKLLLYTPPNKDTGVNNDPTPLTWQPRIDDEDLSWYQIQIAKKGDVNQNGDFITDIVFDHGAGDEGRKNAVYQVSKLDIKILQKGVLYYWHVRPFWNYRSNGTRWGEWSEVRYFRIYDLPSIKTPSILPLYPNVGEPVRIQAEITDDRKINSAKIFYRNGGDVGYKNINLMPDVNTYENSIDRTFVNSKGIEYYIQAIDDQGYVTKSSTYSIQVTVPEPGLVQPLQGSGGNNQNRYQLVSFPLILDKPGVSDVLFDDLGGYDKHKWRFFENGLNSQMIEFISSMAIEKGHAYWLIVSEAGKKIDSGSGKTVPINTDFNIPLVQSIWNFVANPFNFSIPLSKTKFSGSTSVPIFKYFASGDWKTVTDSLRPLMGYAVFSGTAKALILSPQISALFSQVQVPEYDWNIQIIAQDDNYTDSNNFIGTSAAIIPGSDELDLPELPTLDAPTALSFLKTNKQHNLLQLCRDIRSPITNVEEWLLGIVSKFSQKVELKFQGISSLPPNLDIYLVDEYAKTVINLRKQSTCITNSTENSISHLKILIGTDESLQNKLEYILSSPKKYSLTQNFPNPFNPSTTIVFELPQRENVTLTVSNITGQVVATLVENQIHEAGRHALVWDARNTNGERISSGEYFYQIRAGNWLDIKKMILLR